MNPREPNTPQLRNIPSTISIWTPISLKASSFIKGILGSWEVQRKGLGRVPALQTEGRPAWCCRGLGPQRGPKRTVKDS